jgi:lysophosphatidate acyltransferase
VFLEPEPSRLKVRELDLFWYRTVADCKAIANVCMVLVLAPIPTTGITIDEVSALAARVRDQMLTTLREISVTVPARESEKSAVTESLGDAASADLGTPTPTIPGESAPQAELPTETAVPPSPTASTIASQVLSKDGSENGTETEEEEGMVLVGRPK